MKQCEAMTIKSAYSKAHRCLKRHGVKKIGERFLCGHHKSAKGRRDISGEKR